MSGGRPCLACARCPGRDALRRDTSVGSRLGRRKDMTRLNLQFQPAGHHRLPSPKGLYLWPVQIVGSIVKNLICRIFPVSSVPG